MALRRVAIFAFAVVVTAHPSFAYRIAAWIPGWDPNALTSTQTHAGLMSESNPTWYQINSDGTLAKKTAAEDPTWRAAMTGTALMPTLQNTTSSGWNQTAALNVLSTAANREAHAEGIRQLVATQAYAGIDIDYERLPLSARANFTAFIQLLASKLHADGKKLSVTVYAKTSDSETWDGAGGEDYAAIGAAADWVKLMVYDYSYSTSPPGPLTPLTWLDQCVGFAASQMPVAKIMVGLPWYGYDWPSKGAAADLTHPTAISTAQKNGATITYDINGEATFKYGTHTAFFLDAFGHDKQIDLVLQKYPGVAGFCYWYIGSEDPAVWTRIQTLVAPATPPPPQATIVPADPTALTATAISASAITLAWADNSTDEDGFRVERCAGAEATCDAAPAGFAQVSQLGAGTTSYSDGSLNPSTAYTYRVRAYNTAGNSAYSNSSSSTTAALSLPPANAVSGRTLIPAGAPWRYLDNGSDQGTAWRSTIFNDAAWKSGLAQLGYGDGDEKTVVSYGTSSSAKYITTYFRYSFDLADPSAFGSLNLRLLRDDGAVVYLNGVEAYRSNMASGVITYATVAATTINGSDETTHFYSAPVDRNLLVAGRNVVAVEIHQADPSSSDISFDFELTGTLPPPAAPSGLQAVAASQSSVNLTWTDNSANETGFLIERCTGAQATCDASPAGFSQIAQVASNATSYTATSLTASTTYTFRVRSSSADGNSAYAPSAAATTLTPPPPPPSTTATLISFGSVWKYLDNGSDQGTAWRSSSFADTAWKSGAAQLGYGDGDEKTVVSYGPSSSSKYITTYFRQTFSVADPAAFQSLLLRLIRDDGAVVYINGTEVWRSNMPAGTIGYKTLSATGIAGSDESKIFENTVSSSVLVPGTNVIAVEIHQDLGGSSDISLDMEMIGK
ncbi:MAG TPA: glycosyl hydrolase family 18 protein [Thermoanaerobaculia bacterium]|nr:glycosyl hydrolase family 18 protein [Thermoanaerobaculia bacterium]